MIARVIPFRGRRQSSAERALAIEEETLRLLREAVAELDRRDGITSAAESPTGFVRATRRVEVAINQPIRPKGTTLVTGCLVGEMHDRGRLLHYRVDVGAGVLLLAPPEWLHPDSRHLVVRAGLTVPEHMIDGMWVAAIEHVRRKWADKPEGVA